jgi:TM2 domain-containing membrane protein YozV/ribosomal protein L40E
MSEVRLCPLCGRQNSPEAIRCADCGERFSGQALLLEQESELGSWWRASVEEIEGAIPLPPQVREQQIQAERLQYLQQQQEMERRNAQQVARDRLEAARRAVNEQQQKQNLSPQAEAKTVFTCGNCGSELGAAGLDFSFCLRCGADVPTANVVTEATVKQTTVQNPQTVVTFQTPTRQKQQVHQQVSPGELGTANPTAAAFLSFMMPGVGQFMNGQAPKGVLLLLGMFVVSFVFHFSTLGLPMIIVRLLAALDAYRIAERRRAGKFVRESEWDFG